MGNSLRSANALPQGVRRGDDVLSLSGCRKHPVCHEWGMTLYRVAVERISQEVTLPGRGDPSRVPLYVLDHMFYTLLRYTVAFT